jgi:hypothetical protein
MPLASSRLHGVGTWLSLVEHSLGVRGVGSSNLPVPTIFKINKLQNLSPVANILREGSISCKNFRFYEPMNHSQRSTVSAIFQSVQAALDLHEALTESLGIPNAMFV